MTNKYKFFVANWKMFGDIKIIKSINKVVKLTKSRDFGKNKLIYCPPYTLLNSFVNKLKKTKIDVGAQNCHQSYDYGAYTGQVNSSMLKNVGAKYVILGHSENRLLGETDNLINSKIKSAIKSGLKIIFCIGETIKERRAKKTNQILKRQIEKGLKSIKNKSKIIIAYEPVWSIGTGVIPKEADLNKTISFIKSRFIKNYPKILYGGSVNTNNVSILKKIPNIDGFLIGGASQIPKKFIDIIKKTIN